MTGRSRFIAGQALSLLATVARRKPGGEAPCGGAWRIGAVALPAVCLALLLLLVGGPGSVRGQQGLVLQEYPVAAGSHPHDAVPDRLGRAWYSAQGDGTIGRLDPATGVRRAGPGPGSAPHGILMGPDGGVWVTDGGLNAIVRVEPDTMAVQVYPLPGPQAALNTLTFDGRGILWFTGQAGDIGRLDPACRGRPAVRCAPRQGALRDRYRAGRHGLLRLPGWQLPGAHRRR